MILQVLLFIFGILFLIGFTIIKLKANKDIQKLDVTANMPLIENSCRKEFTNGYYSGTIKSQLPRKNGTTLIEFYPNDVEQGENIERPALQSVIVKNEYIKRFAKGELSSRREVVILVGRNPADYPIKMQDTTKGEWMTKEGQLGFIRSIVGKAIPRGDEALEEHLKEQSRTGITKSTFAQLKEANKKFRELQNTEEKPEEK